MWAYAMDVETYIYFVRQLTGVPVGWWPASPSEASVAFSVLGIMPTPIGTDAEPPSLSVPTIALARNPASGPPEFLVSLPRSAEPSIRIYDVRGHLIRVLAERSYPTGLHKLTWDGRTTRGQPVASGVYFYRFGINGDHLATDKLLVIR